MEGITNEGIKTLMEIEKCTLNYVEEKSLFWYGHVRRARKENPKEQGQVDHSATK